MVKYNIHITDPDSPLFMFQRIDEHVHVSGHSYLPCDAACGRAQCHSRKYEVIPDKNTWEKIMRECNESNPNCVIPFDQHLHRDFSNYLKQHFVGNRNGHDGTAALISKGRWRNYGIGEILINNKLETVEYPGEVWIRYSNSPLEMPQRVDLRRNCKGRSLYRDISVGVSKTRSLPQLSDL